MHGFGFQKARLAEWQQALIAGVVGAVAMVLFLLADAPETARRQAAEKLDVLGQASVLRARLESQINEHLRVTEAVAGLISVRGLLSDGEFLAVAQALHAHAPAMRNLGVTNGTVVRQVYPLQGNEAIIGLRYQDLPTQWPLVEQAIRERTSVLAGPVRLVQGGNGLIERTPIFQQETGEFIGIVSLVLNSDDLFAIAGLNSTLSLDVALARRFVGATPTQNELDVFYGRSGLVDQNPLQLDVQMLGADWVMLVTPKGGWSSGVTIYPLRLALQSFISLAIALGCYFLIRYVGRLHQALQQLAESEERLKSAQSVAKIGDLEWSPISGVMQWSDEVYRILGYPVGNGQVHSDELWRAIHPEDRAVVGNALQDAYRTGEPLSLNIRLLAADDRQRWGHLNVLRVSKDHGERLFATLTDISDRQREDEDRRRMLTRLRRSNEELEQFTWVASHHLQEPLRMIGSYLQLLDRRYRDSLDEDARAFIAFASKGAQRMQNLIIDLLAYTRVTAEQGPPETVSIRQVIEIARQPLDAQLNQDDVTLDFGALPTVSGWRDQLVSVFHALLVNALQYRSVHRPLEIRIGAERKGGFWEFRIADNGQGIDPVFHSQIFKIFRRLSSDDNDKGTGMGLALCLRVIEHHGGTLRVESQVDHGATFIFTLPVGSETEQA